MSIEEPFSILPLEAMCDNIQRDVAELQLMHCPGECRLPGGVPASELVQAAVDGSCADSSEYE